MANRLNGKKAAILPTEGVAQVELLEPRKALLAEGTQALVVSPMKGKIRGWNFTDWGQAIST